MDSEPALDVARPTGPDIFWSSLKAGGITGLAGLSMGGVAGLIRSSAPTLFAVASGIQCFTLGGTYWAARQTTLVFQAQRHGMEMHALNKQQRLEASTFAGAASGATVAALFRGRSNILPGTIMFSIFGFLGQRLYSALDTRHAQSDYQAPARGVWETLLKSRFNPMKVLSDEEYGNMLKEKLIRVEAEIALIDESINKVKRENNQRSNDPPK